MARKQFSTLQIIQMLQQAETEPARGKTVGQDCKWVSQPWWPDQFADAYVAALKDYFN